MQIKKRRNKSRKEKVIMKKLLTVFLILSMLIGVLSSCGARYLELRDKNSDSVKETMTGDFSKETTGETNSEDMANQGAMAEGGVDNTSDTSVPEYPEDYNYTINKIDGKWYMDFDSYVTPPVIVEGSHMERNFTFSSFDEMYNTLIAAKSLTKTEKIYIINWYDKTENGIEIINFDELYVPVLPSSADITSILLLTTTYGAVVSDKASGKSIGRLTYLESSQDFDNKYNGLVTDENNYILTEGDKTVIVEKMQLNDGIDIDVYIKQGDQYCLVQLLNVTESPTDEYFLQFGLEKWQKPE